MTATTMDTPAAIDDPTTGLVQVYGLEHALTLKLGTRVITTAIATGYGWHISLGRQPVGHGHRRTNRYGDRCSPYQPARCAWLSCASRTEAVDKLYMIGSRLLAGGHR